VVVAAVFFAEEESAALAATDADDAASDWKQRHTNSSASKSARIMVIRAMLSLGDLCKWEALMKR
jgi:hypothetical protein